jgi:TRAP-type C4-dicarboxylate transport system permease small subunit
MRRFLDGLYLAAAALAACCVAMIAALMIAQSLGRQLGVSTGAINDIVAWLCAAAAFLSMAHAFRHGDFVRVTLVQEKLSERTRQAIELLCLGVAAVAVGYLAYWALRFTWQSREFNELAQGLLPIPIWWPQSMFAIGSVLLWIAILDELSGVVRGRVPTYERLLRERHAKGDFSSDV